MVLTARLCGNRRTGKTMIRISQIVKDRQINGQDAHGGTADSQSRSDPMHRRIRGPSEPEQAGGHEHCLDTGEIETFLWGVGKLHESADDSFLVDTDEGGDDHGDTHC